MASTMTPRTFTSLVCQSCRLRLKPSTAITKRPFSTTPIKAAGDELSALGIIGNNNRRREVVEEDSIAELLNPGGRYINDNAGRNLDATAQQPPHRLHVLATKHNTHLTLVQAPRPASETASSGVSSTNASAASQKKMLTTLLSISAGNIGFRKAGRSSYDAAYQLTAFTLKQMKEKGMLGDIKKLEIVMRGFGAGREAVTKAILGAEGKDIRNKITAVVDATRLKIGGTRSPRPRRLG